jgi:hypothetical protein
MISPLVLRFFFDRKIGAGHQYLYVHFGGSDRFLSGRKRGLGTWVAGKSFRHSPTTIGFSFNRCTSVIDEWYGYRLG